MKSEKIMKVQRVFLAVTIGLIFFASCTKEEAIIPTYDASFYEKELVYGIDDDEDEPPRQVYGQLYNPIGNSLSQGGIVYLLDNNNPIDMCVTSNGKFKFTELEYKGYSLKYDINGYLIKTVENVYPQNEILHDTIY